jgi:aminopeptidase N
VRTDDSVLARVFLLLLLAAPDAALAVPPTFDVLDYEADLRIDLVEQSVRGEVAVTFTSMADGLSVVELEAPGLTVESVSEKGLPVSHKVKEGRLRAMLAQPATRGERRTLSIRYAGKPERGMRFATDQVFTSFHTGHWLVSRSEPADKATLTLALTLPSDLVVVASGRPVSREELPGGLARHVWREDRPYSTYVFGFAAGRFREASRQVGGVRLRFLAPGLTPEELDRAFVDTEAMLTFFETKAGAPFPGEAYPQVLLPGAPAQEMSSFSLMSEAYGRSVLADPREDYLIAHELAHQWWGNLVTCETWSDFWLNEGMVTFLTAAYKEHQWGRDEYERERAMARLRYERVAVEGKDRPLVHHNWSTPEDMSGPVAYSKGALVLHLLRVQLGERAFWEGLRDYTRAGAGGSVDSEDLRAALEKASGRDLKPFFAQWVYGVAPDLVARHRAEKGEVVVEIEQRQESLWTVPLIVAVETERGRESRRVELRQRKEVLRLAVDAPVLSVRIDEGGELPLPVRHERPPAMLRYQMVEEPDLPGRVEALEALEKACGTAPGESGCGDLGEALEERVATGSSRLVRQLAARALERLAPKATAPGAPG